MCKVKIPYDLQSKINDILDNNYTTYPMDTSNSCIKHENNQFEIIVHGKNLVVVTDKRSSHRVIYNDIDTAYHKIKGCESLMSASI